MGCTCIHGVPLRAQVNEAWTQQGPVIGEDTVENGSLDR